jgi:peptide deformylase|tara:strand:- start:141 stop:653 length:513 start_codon:yes stop_codon:yes gene_type:complete
MNLILAPDVMLENPVKHYDVGQLHPAPIALDMIDVMTKYHGLGISANQVGLDRQIFVMRCMLNTQFKGNLVVINPIIKGLSEQRELGVEGCLSHPGLQLHVKRPISCVVEFETLTPDMRDVIHLEAKFDDIDARVFLHEYDHLHGIQYIDRVSKLKLKMAEKKRNKKVNG